MEFTVNYLRTIANCINYQYIICYFLCRSTIWSFSTPPYCWQSATTAGKNRPSGLITSISRRIRQSGAWRARTTNNHQWQWIIVWCKCLDGIIILLIPIILRFYHPPKKILHQTLQITTPSQIRKTWNAKYTLRSHFDGVRALAFHPTEPVLITASEDQTLKLWNLQKVN